MPEDPAITEAKRLWKERQTASAVQVLMHRINELNATAKPTPRTPKGQIAIWKALLFMVVIIGGTVVGFYAYNVYQQGSGENDTVTRIDLQLFCQFQLIGPSDLECEQWAWDIVRSDHYKDAKLCISIWDKFEETEALASCLMRDGIRMPGL
jgi:hypothetical protein